MRYEPPNDRFDAPAVARSTARLRKLAEDEGIEHVLFGHRSIQQAKLDKVYT